MDKLLDDAHKTQNPANLRKAIWRVVHWELFVIGMFKVIGDTAVVSSPLVLIYLLNYVNRSKTEDTSTSEGFLYVCLFFILGFVNSVTFNWYWQASQVVGVF